VFDAALAVALFTCIPDLAAQRRAAAEIHRVLRPGGLLWASFFLLNRDRRNRERYRRLAHPGSRDWGLFRLAPDGLLRHHALAHLRRLFRRFRWLLAEEQRFHTMGGHTSRGLILLACKEDR
jgi:SAM-dependent methyltransferase